MYSNSSNKAGGIDKLHICANIILVILTLRLGRKDDMQIAEIRGRLFSDLERFKTPDGYLSAGYPYFGTLYGRDGLTTGLQMLGIDSNIAKAILYWLAQYQAKITSDEADSQPGRILHVLENNLSNMPNREYPYFGSVDAPPLFVVLAGEYFKETHDKEFLSQISSNIVAAMEWLSVYGDADNDHFIEYERKNPYGDYHQGWKDCVEDHLKIDLPVAIVEVQGYAYAAYRAAADLADQLGMDKSLANSWLEKAEELRKAFHKSFWWEEESYYYLALDGSKKPRKSVTSNPGHLLFTGIIPEEVLDKVIDRIFQLDLFTQYGVRTLSQNDPDFDPLSYHLGPPWIHDNWWIYYGLKKLGRTREAALIKQATISTYRALGCAPELHGVTKEGQIFPLTEEGGEYVHHPGPNPGYANRLQAWATCGLLDMLRED